MYITCNNLVPFNLNIPLTRNVNDILRGKNSHLLISTCKLDVTKIASVNNENF